MDDGHKTTLGTYVRRLREDRAMSLRSLAAKVGVDASWIGRLEQDEYETPDPRLLYRLARALDVEVADFHLLVGYADGQGLPEFVPYLRSKYDLPDEAVAQLEAHFALINEKYKSNEESHHDT